MSARLRLLTLGHSYVVAETRRLAHELARAGGDRWDVTAAAPRRYRGDLRPIELAPIPGEANHLEPLEIRFDRSPHLMWFSGLGSLLSRGWDLVHAWQEPYVLAGAQIARATPRDAKLVVASFQNIRKRYPFPFSAFERFTIGRADAWIPFGQTVLDALGPSPPYAGKPCRVIPPGVDVERFTPDPAARRRLLERLGWAETDRVVGFLGRFVPAKGLDVLMTALQTCPVPWRAIFVGGGPMNTQLEAFAASRPGRVHVETGVTHADVPAWLNAMTVLCAPSQTTPQWREQFGRMLIEAMACGVPVIASDSGEMPSVIGDAGVIAPEADATRWSVEIARILDDDAVRHDLAARGRQRAHARFAWPVVAREHLDFFETLVRTAA